MAEGQKAAEDTKSALHEAGQASESLRQNINSFADDLLGGNKQHSSTGIHPDAKKTGDGLAEGAGSVAGKVENMVDKHKKS